MFPAPVGMNRNRCYSKLRNNNVPRACGDEPKRLFITDYRASMFPAPVGMNRKIVPTKAKKRDVPRACGDEPI